MIFLLQGLLQNIIESPGSAKSWRLLSNPDTPHRLCLAVTVMTSVENVLSKFFAWQSDQSWLATEWEKLPLVILSNMRRSPVARAMDHLVSLLTETGSDVSVAFAEEELKHFPQCLRVFLFLYRGYSAMETARAWGVTAVRTSKKSRS